MFHPAYSFCGTTTYYCIIIHILHLFQPYYYYLGTFQIKSLVYYEHLSNNLG